MEIYLIRHTTPDVAKGICYGQTDLGVKTSFGEEVSRLKTLLPERFDHIYHSPLQRCVQLAQEFESPIVKTDDRLKEMSFGDWEMLPWNDIPKEQLDPFMQDFVNLCPPQGESFNIFHERVNAFFNEIPYEEGKTVGIFAHGGVIRSIICGILDIPLEKAFQVVVDFGRYCKLKRISADITNVMMVNA
ncbi:alpha-ribazole phosphatase [Limibacter armeniacum]|uniref:alpha-ribazole phosphatase n=1 Tax=Limibacter armeniacum TaxID=466084 RepID=UPI002FE5B957